MRDARKLYESLSEEFARKGIASNRFSELEQLFKIADVSLVEYDDKDKELTQLKQFAKEAIKVAEFYGDKNNWRLHENKLVKEYKVSPEIDLSDIDNLEMFAGKTAREFQNSDIFKQIKESLNED